MSTPTIHARDYTRRTGESHPGLEATRVRWRPTLTCLPTITTNLVLREMRRADGTGAWRRSLGRKWNSSCARLILLIPVSDACLPSPMISLYSRDLPRAVAFYCELGFVETFRTPASGEPAHVELRLDGFTLGIATLEAAREHHGLRPEGIWPLDRNRSLDRRHRFRRERIGRQGRSSAFSAA